MKKDQYLFFSVLPFSSEQQQRLARAISHKQLKKGEAVFHQGEKDGNVYLLRKGLVKLCYNTHQGKELIKSFISEGSILGSLECLVNGRGASFSAVALEPLELEVVSYPSFILMVDESPQLQQFMVKFYQQLALKKEQREYQLLCLSAEERYQRFIAQYPEIHSRIKQAELALYLGITPIALSRIKNRNREE